jgi:hypothetical protein
LRREPNANTLSSLPLSRNPPANVSSSIQDIILPGGGLFCKEFAEVDLKSNSVSGQQLLPNRSGKLVLDRTVLASQNSQLVGMEMA